MVLVKILKRRDASSVVVAVSVAFLVVQLLGTFAPRLSALISGLKSEQVPSFAPPGSGWQGEYLYPIVSFLVALLLLEVLAWIYILLGRAFADKRVNLRRR